MEKARKYPFYSILAKKNSVKIINYSSYKIPREKDFFLWIRTALVSHNYYRASIGVFLCDKNEAKIYNKKYRNKDYATNILSFSLEEENKKELIGDLVLCPEVIEKEAKEQNKALKAHYAHLIIHGILHLMGYDHEEDKEAQVMENLEIQLLQSLNYNNPYKLEDITKNG